jgi:phosphohistidine phosphatase SixA
VERRPDAPTRRALTLGLPWIPLLGWGLGRGLGPQAAQPPRQPPEQKEDQDPAARPPALKRRLSSVVVLLRHAEKDTGGDTLNPGLSEAGRQRARDLARLLARSRVTHLFASRYRRAQETLEPFAAAAGLKINTNAGAIAAELGPHLLSLPAGSIAVCVGHSNTIPALVAALGAEIQGLESSPQGPVLAETDYNRLFVLTPPAEPGGRTLLLELAYGA